MSHQPSPPPAFHRVERLFFLLAVVLMAVVLIDNLSFKPLAGDSIRGADSLFAALAVAFLLVAALRRRLARKLALAVVVLTLFVAVLEAGLSLSLQSGGRSSPWYVWPPRYSSLLKPHGLVGVSEEGRFTANSLRIRRPELGDGQHLSHGGVQSDNARGGVRSGVELVDLAARIPRMKKNFYDDCHFNEQGAEAAAALLAETVRLGLPRTPAQSP
jgi:hypothetical protein